MQWGIRGHTAITKKFYTFNGWGGGRGQNMMFKISGGLNQWGRSKSSTRQIEHRQRVPVIFTLQAFLPPQSAILDHMRSTKPGN